MVVDYSRTINRFTLLDAYPIPSIESIVNKLARYTVYSMYDLKSAFYQIPIRESEKHFTAFEADGQLWEFNQIPFGVTNGPPAFQRYVDEIIRREKLQVTDAYFDNISVAGDDQAEHDYNRDRFLAACKKYGLVLNEDKTISSVTSIGLLGYLVSKGSIKPDPERMRPLMELPIPLDHRALQRALGLFAYYAKWVDRYSDRVRPLVHEPSFPLSEECVIAFEEIKHRIADACVVCPSGSEELVLESDASDFALSASLSQGGRPVAFFSRTLKQHERKHHAVEKEACAIVEACRKWSHYLTGRKFRLITDQQAVSFMFDQSHHGKIKNDKIQRWRIELSTFNFDIQYRPGPLNFTADCLSRADSPEPTVQPPSPAHCAVSSNHRTLQQLHNDLAHPGIVRMHHFVKTRNLPYIRWGT